MPNEGRRFRRNSAVAYMRNTWLLIYFHRSQALAFPCFPASCPPGKASIVVPVFTLSSYASRVFRLVLPLRLLAAVVPLLSFGHENGAVRAVPFKRCAEQWCSSTFSDSMLAAYEMTNPSDAFGKMMLQNIQVRGVIIRCLLLLLYCCRRIRLETRVSV